MNRKYILPIFGVFVLALISAVLVTNYVSHQTSLEVNQSISVNGLPADTILSDSLSVSNGWKQKYTSSAYVITNDAERDLNVNVLSTPSDGDILVSHDTVGLSTTWSSDADAFADASLSSGVVSLEADKHAVDWSDASESRITIDGSDVGVSTLADFMNMSWDVSSGTGYAPHVDLFLDNGMVLTWEYAKTQTPYDNSGSYPTGSFNTFNDKGIIDGNAEAWIQPGCPGGSQIVIHTLDEWKAGVSGDTYNFPCDGTGTVNVAGFSVDGSTGVDRIEIEIDAWISDSSADVSNLVVNGVQKSLDTVSSPVVVLKDGGEQVFYVNTLIPASLSSGSYTIDTVVN